MLDQVLHITTWGLGVQCINGVGELKTKMCIQFKVFKLPYGEGLLYFLPAQGDTLPPSWVQWGETAV